MVVKHKINKDKQQRIKEVKRNFERNMEVIENCPFFPEYPGMFFRQPSKMELKQRLVSKTIELLVNMDLQYQALNKVLKILDKKVGEKK